MTSLTPSTKKFGMDFLTWCVAQRWDYLLVLQKPKAATSGETDQYLQQLIQEIEVYDGTLEFRWVRFDPISKNSDNQELYLLVGGTSSGQWWYWGHRWREINGDPDALGGFGYSRQRKSSHLRGVLKDFLAERGFTVRIGIGPSIIRRRRTLRVGEDNMPIRALPPVSHNR
jgi:hypothetical protein